MAEAARLEAWARYYESQQPAPQRGRPRLDPRPAAARRRGERAAAAAAAILAGRDGSAGSGGGGRGGGRDGGIGALSDQYEADLTNLILAWHHRLLHRRLPERHGRR